MVNLKVVFLLEWYDNPYRKLLTEHLKYNGIQVEEYSWSYIFLPRVVRQQIPDILHLQTLHTFIIGKTALSQWIKFFVFLGQILILKFLGTKIVWTVHEWADKIGDNKHQITSLQAKILGKVLHAIITHYFTMRDEITEAFHLKNKDKVFVVPHGNYIGSYENKVDRLEARKTLGLPGENLVFLFFGTIHRSKGILEAIDAFKSLPKDGVSLLIAGQPVEWDNQLNELIINKIKGCENILFFSNRVPDDEVQVYMNASDCVVVPYKIFTTSGVAILAMSFGRACIAPNVGFFSDVLDEFGAILYDSTHPEGLLFAMKDAIEKKNNLLEMGKHNFELAEQWNWNYVAEETLKIYQHCLEH